MKLSTSLIATVAVVAGQDDLPEYSFDYSLLDVEVYDTSDGADDEGRYGATTTSSPPDPTLPGVTLAGGPMLAGFGCFHCDAIGATTAETYEMCATIGQWKECPAGDNYYCMYEGRTETTDSGTETVSMCTGCKAQDSCVNQVHQNFGAALSPLATQCRPEDASSLGRRFRANAQASVCRTCFNPCEENSELCFQAGAGTGGVTQNNMVAGVFGIPHSVSDTPAAPSQTGAFFMDPTAQTDRTWWGMDATDDTKTHVEAWQDTNIDTPNALADI